MNRKRKYTHCYLKTYGFFFFFFLLSLSVTALAQNKAEEAPQRGDAFISGVTADAKTLVPILACDSASANICSLIFNGLIKYNKDLELTADLAQNWEIQDNGLKIVFHLKKGVKWHDGKEFTAQDVEFTYKKLIDPQVQTPYSSDFLKVKEFHILDPYTIEIIYDTPFSPALSTWGMWIMPKHILENENLNLTDFSSHPIGTGPYKFKNWKRQEEIELTSNEQYFEGCPFIGRYISKVIPDQTTIFLELQTKSIDACPLTPLQFLRQTENTFFKKNYLRFRLNSFSYTYLGYNLEDQRFKDKKVRQALNFAVNKKEIIQIVLLGQGKEATGPFIPRSWGYNDSVINAEFSPEHAIELLRQAGWQDTNQDGILDKNGKNFEFTIITSQGNEARVKTAELIQKYLKNIGIKVKIKVLEWSALLDEYINKQRFEAILLGWSLSMDPDCYDIWHSSKIKQGEFNFVHYKNLEVDQLLEKARVTFDIELRKKYYHQIHALIYEDQPYMFLYSPDSLEVVSSRFKGIDPAPIGIGYNFIKWWVPEKQQRYKSK